MSGLPKGWVEDEASQICDLVQSGGTPKEGFIDKPGVPFLKVYNIVGQKIDFEYRPQFIDLDVHRSSMGKSQAIPGDVLMNIVGPPLGKVAVIPDTFPMWNINQALTIFRPNEAITSEWLYYFLCGGDSVNSVINETRGSAGQVNISLSQCRSFKLPLPPVAEQKRIVAKLDALNAKSARARTELARIETLVSRYKQAVLSKAFRGELTQTYRFQRSSLGKESETTQVHKRQVVPRKLKVREATDIMKAIHLPPLPTGWNWVQNHSLAQNNANAICAGPFGTIFKAKDFRDKGVPIIFLRHVGPGQYRTHKPGFMDEHVWRELHQPYSVFGGELLVTKLGDPPGVACIYPHNAETAMVTPDVIKMSVDEAVSQTSFLMYYFNSPIAKSVIQQLAFGLTRLRVDLAMFKNFPIPLPSLEEQHEIVRRIESAFGKIDRLAGQAKRALELAGKLDEAILAKAFRGELVPQDETDEPADRLLARIRAERQAAPKARRGRGAKA